LIGCAWRKRRLAPIREVSHIEYCRFYRLEWVSLLDFIAAPAAVPR
jgi:hypothetical protein